MKGRLEAARLAREMAVELLGENQVEFFDEHGYMIVEGNNGYRYWIFDRISAEEFGTAETNEIHNILINTPWEPDEGAEPAEWLVWGYDTAQGFDCMRFFMYGSYAMPRYDELAAAAVELMVDTNGFIMRGCRPGGSIQTPILNRLLQSANLGSLPAEP